MSDKLLFEIFWFREYAMSPILPSLLNVEKNGRNAQIMPLWSTSWFLDSLEMLTLSGKSGLISTMELLNVYDCDILELAVFICVYYFISGF